MRLKTGSDKHLDGTDTIKCTTCDIPVNRSVTMVLRKDVECYDSSGTSSYLSNSDWRHDVNQFSVPRDQSQRPAVSATSSFIINFRFSEIELRNPLCLMLA
ncbi:hypothetical protein J6590_081333 [Homalodisca vitripennis]|nr:hypothetical protein J6590_081333 [Homalodisca vitripennis]